MQSRDAHRATALKGPAAKAMSQGTIAKQERLLAEYAILSGSHWRRARAAARGQGCGIFGQAG
jgi:hypothetical protein